MIMEYKGIGPEIGKNVYISENATVIGNVVIEDDVNIWFSSVIRGDVNRVFIGERTNVQDLTMIHCAGEYETYIGKDVTIGHSAIIHACRIGDNSLIGMGACILDGAEIGENSIVGAKSLVPGGKKFKPNSLILGSPAKVVRELTESEIKSISRSATHYVELAGDYKGGDDIV